MGDFVTASGFEKTFAYAQLFQHGLVITVLLAACTVFFGFFLGILLAMLRMSDVRPFRSLGLDRDGHLRGEGFLLAVSRFNPLAFLATVYVEVIRSTPVIVQIFIVYHGVFGVLFDLPKFNVFGLDFIKFHRFFPGVVALAMNSGAYLCEIIRSGIQSVDGGQGEAARSLGLSRGQTLRFIILPQAIRNILPAIGNEFVTIIKESAITYTIGVEDIMAAVEAVRGATWRIMEPLIVATLLYFCLCFPTSKIIAYFERRMSRGSKR